MNYRQLNEEERGAPAALHAQGASLREIASYLGRHWSTIGRELKRNATPHDGRYRARRGHERAEARRRRTRRRRQFGLEPLRRVEAPLREQWSPEQVAGYLRRRGEVLISHETIYRHVGRDWKAGGTLHLHLPGARKNCRKRYGRRDSRGRLAGKRMIGERPAWIEKRRCLGHWEIDTMMGQSLGESSACILTLVERKSGDVFIGKLEADNGTEFHGDAAIEAARAVKFYFATPHHSRERGTNQNTNGLIRQYLPKGQSMAGLTQRTCDVIARQLNNRPRKRHAYKTPNECFPVS